MNVIDRLISAISPTTGLKRAAARQHLAALENASMDYNAASRGRRTNGWRANASGAVSEISRARNRLRFVGRDMVRNNPVAAKVPKIMAQNIIGKGIIPNTIGASKSRKAQVEKLLKAHLDKPLIDYNGQLNLYGIQNQAMEAVVTDGEVLIVQHRPKRLGKLKLPLQLQVLEIDYLDSTRQTINRKPGESYIVNGIQFSPRGVREGYWINSEHPGDTFRIGNRKSTFFPAERVIHLYRVDRPGQINGISWFHPGAVKMADLHDFGDARLYREKIAGAFTAFITRNDEQIQGLKTNTSAKDFARYPLEEISPGTIEHLQHGDQVSFGSPPQTDGFGEFWSASALEIAMSLGISYFALTGDASKGNFSSSRMGWLEDVRFFEKMRNDIVFGMLLHPVTEWLVQSVNMVAPGSPFELEWTAPARDLIDPLRDVKAGIAAVDAGFKSETQVIREMGRDEQDVHAERIEDARRNREVEKEKADAPQID